MSLRKKFLIIFSVFISILIFLWFDFSEMLINSQKSYSQHTNKERAILDLYKRRDLIKTLLFIDDYQFFSENKKLLKTTSLGSDLEKLDIIDDIGKLEILEDKIIGMHEKKLHLISEFNEIYKTEKSTRHSIRDIVYRNKVYNEVKAYGEVAYVSKEALFQYRDKNHMSSWKNTVENLIKASKTSELLEVAENYSEISVQLSTNLLLQNNLSAEVENAMTTYNKVLKTADKNVYFSILRINQSLEKIKKNLYFKLVNTIFMFIILFVVLGFFIHYNLIKPLEILERSTDEISKKNFSYQIKMNKNDEIGHLANHFNKMILNLKELYSNLENKVMERTLELEEMNSLLVSEISEREKLEKVLKKQAFTDELTGLFNRRAAYKFLSKSLISSYNFMTICYLDIDNFKQINDIFGHREGDRYLKRFSEILKDAFREDDYIFRMGGDEFIAVFPIKHVEEVESFFKKRVLPELRLQLDIEFSYGIYEFIDLKNLKVDEIIQKVDAKMYENKQKKKNLNKLPMIHSLV